jgi:hypothetical protein
MRIHSLDLDLDEPAPQSLAAMAERLRMGPLQELHELQRHADRLADRPPQCPRERLEDLERLVQLSISAMEHFRVFTRDVQLMVREMTDARLLDKH